MNLSLTYSSLSPYRSFCPPVPSRLEMVQRIDGGAGRDFRAVTHASLNRPCFPGSARASLGRPAAPGRPKEDPEEETAPRSRPVGTTEEGAHRVSVDLSWLCRPWWCLDLLGEEQSWVRRVLSTLPSVRDTGRGWLQEVSPGGASSL